MKLLYEASNTLEAHMIVNLLEQSGLSARVDGEYLQGGMGELQAIGLVRVMIDESDYLEAKKIVDEWDASQPKIERTSTIKKDNLNIMFGIVGFICGLVVMAALYKVIN